MLALKFTYQSLFRVVSLGVCSASKKQVFGISGQWDYMIGRQIMAIFEPEKSPQMGFNLELFTMLLDTPRCSQTFIFITTWSASLGWETY